MLLLRDLSWDLNPELKVNVSSHSPWLQHSFPPCWPLHKPFLGGKNCFSHSFRAQHCPHSRKKIRCQVILFLCLTFCCLWRLFSESWKSIPSFDCLFASLLIVHVYRAASLLRSYTLSPIHSIDRYLALHSSPFVFIKLKSLQRSYLMQLL